MHYYQFNIGDYASHTRHLDPMEDLIYRRLLDIYYLHERPLNENAALVAKQIGLKDHSDSVRDVLNEFFEKTEEGYRSLRADKEIAAFHSKIEQASRAGKASAERRLNARSTDVQPNNKQETINNNHKPIKNNTAAKTEVLKAPEGVSSQVWETFLQQRKKARAVVTDTVIATIAKEAQKVNWTLEEALSECAARGWRGFKGDWVKPKFDDLNQNDEIPY